MLKLFLLFKKIGDIITNMSIAIQFVLLAFSSLIIVVSFGIIYNSFETSLSFFVDPGYYTGVIDKYPLVGFIETLLGIFVFGSVISLITTSILSIVEKNKLRAVHGILEESFETISNIQARQFVKKNQLVAERRNFNLDEAEIRLEVTKDEITNAIRMFGNLRLRKIKDISEIVIENFSGNTEYGSFVDRKSPITIIATQNYSDAGIGHFAATIANSINANYISNEYFSSGAPLKSKQINFAKHQSYANFFQKDNNCKILDTFKFDLIKLSEHTKLFIYLGTSNANREHNIHLLFGGEKGNVEFDIKNKTYKDIEYLKKVFIDLKNNLNDVGQSIATHEEYGNDESSHLVANIHKQFGIDTLTLYISTSILWDSNDLNYFTILNTIKNGIKNFLNKNQIIEN
ncbi:MAG: hypothetical protein IBX44_00015 [Sulfurospirillum sp.]|nr:hypothetical protein [Sulfurospirillum sp.]